MIRACHANHKSRDSSSGDGVTRDADNSGMSVLCKMEICLSHTI